MDNVKGINMKTFNAFQLVILLVIWPHLIQWLSTAEFRGNGAAFWSAIVIYVVQIGYTVYAYRRSFE